MPRDKNTALEQLIGRHLKAARETAGFSTRQLAERFGVSYQQIHKFERGDNRITVSFLIEIAELYGLSPSEMLAKINDDWENEPAQICNTGEVGTSL